VISVKPQGFTCSWAEFSRKIRLAGNLKTAFLQAIVDHEGHVNYYQVDRITP
jgi:tRNA splicing endonuclease